MIKLVEDLVVNETSEASAQLTDRDQGSETCLVVDGMGVVQELMAVQNGKTCNEHATSYITLIDAKARVYCQVLVIFDSYTKEASMKAQTRERRKGKVGITKSYIVQDSTGIKDNNMFLSITKDSLNNALSFPSAHPLQCRQSYDCNTTGGYETVCLEKSGALINWNALTGCDTTGDIHGKG